MPADPHGPPEPEVLYRIALHPRRKDRWSVVTPDGRRAVSSTGAEVTLDEYRASLREQLPRHGLELRADNTIVRIAPAKPHRLARSGLTDPRPAAPGRCRRGQGCSPDHA